MKVKCLMAFRSDPSHNGPSGSLKPIYGYFLSSEVHYWNRGTQKNAHMGSLICRVRTITVGKARWEPLVFYT